MAGWWRRPFIDHFYCHLYLCLLCLNYYLSVANRWYFTFTQTKDRFTSTRLEVRKVVRCVSADGREKRKRLFRFWVIVGAGYQILRTENGHNMRPLSEAGSCILNVETHSCRWSSRGQTHCHSAEFPALIIRASVEKAQVWFYTAEITSFPTFTRGELMIHLHCTSEIEIQGGTLESQKVLVQTCCGPISSRWCLCWIMTFEKCSNLFFTVCMATFGTVPSSVVVAGKFNAFFFQISGAEWYILVV